MFRVLGSEERALMVIEPPRQTRIAGVFEIHDGILVAIKQTVLKELGGLMGHAGVVEFGIGMERAADKAAEKCRRRGAVETMIVIENSNVHPELTGVSGGKPIIVPECRQKCN